MANCEKLLEVRDFLTEHPERLNMSVFITVPNDYVGTLTRENFTESSASGCYAGWCLILNGWHVKCSSQSLVFLHPADVHEYGVPEMCEVAAQILELTELEAHELFFCFTGELSGVVNRLLESGSDV